MWIIDNRNQQKYIPRFYNVFNDYQPFEAVLLLDANAGKELHRLIRKAEGPLHDNLSLKLLRPEESKKLVRALKEIREFIKTKIPRIEAKEYSPDDALVVDSEGQDGPGTGVKQMAFSGAAVEVGARNRRREIPGLDPDPNPVPTPPRPTPPHPNPNPNPVPAPFEPSRTPLRFTALAVPTGVRSCRIRLTCPTDCEDADLSLKVDENQDVTLRSFMERGERHIQDGSKIRDTYQVGLKGAYRASRETKGRNKLRSRSDVRDAQLRYRWRRR